MVGLFAIVVFVLLLASLARSSVLYDRLEGAKEDLRGADESYERWRNEHYQKLLWQFEESEAENRRLKKAASKLIVQVAQDFGKEVTNPKQAK